MAIRKPEERLWRPPPVSGGGVFLCDLPGGLDPLAEAGWRAGWFSRWLGEWLVEVVGYLVAGRYILKHVLCVWLFGTDSGRRVFVQASD